VNTHLSAARIRLIVHGERPSGLQLVHERDDIVRGDQRQTASAKPGQQVAAQLRAVEIECAIPTLTG
jgi:hypothetical protein